VPGTRLVVVGDGPARAALERRFAGLPVRFTGYLRGDELAIAYASADAFAFGSDTDTFGQVILEAMASGLPVVAARAGGAVDLVEEGRSGFLFEPGEVHRLAAHLRALGANPALHASLGAGGRRIAERRSWSSVMDELVGHYRRAAAMHPAWNRVLDSRRPRALGPPVRPQAAISP
jgi:phosphatidylinositol alpha 1,6-mannosyltransferase